MAERVEYYMGGWNETFADRIDVREACRMTRVDHCYKHYIPYHFLWELEDLELLSRDKRETPGNGYSPGTLDVMRSITPPLRAVWARFGDVNGNMDNRLPVAMKAGLPRGEKRHPGNRGIIWPIKMAVHYHAPFHAVAALEAKGAVPRWDEKHETLVWRGRPTGGSAMDRGDRAQIFNGNHQRVHAVKTYFNYDAGDIDVALTKYPAYLDKRGALTKWVRPRKSIGELLRYKYLLVMEGHDVATSLKWMLYSNSVVFMSQPTICTYAMEELLVPWTHYIPVKADLSDLPDKLEWARNNDEMCRWVSEQATSYAERLWASERGQREYAEVRRSLARRYRELFGRLASTCLARAQECRGGRSATEMRPATPDWKNCTHPGPMFHECLVNTSSGKRW